MLRLNEAIHRLSDNIGNDFGEILDGDLSWWPYVLQIWNTGGLNPVDTGVYYIGNWIVGTSIDSTDARLYVPQKWILRKCYIEIRNWGTLWSAETSNMSILVTTPAWVTTEYPLSPSITTNNVNNSFNDTLLNIYLNEGDFIWIKWNAPTWVTNPTSLTFVFTFAVEPQPCIVPWSKQVIQWWCTWLNPTSLSTYYIWDWPWTTGENVRIRIPYTWIVTLGLVNIRCATNWLPSSWNAELFVLKNGVSEQSIWTSGLLVTNNDIMNTTMSLSVNAWDYLSLKMTNPTRTTLPTWLVINFSFVITAT